MVRSGGRRTCRAGRGGVQRAAVHVERGRVRVQRAARRFERVPGAWSRAWLDAGVGERVELCGGRALHVPLWRGDCERELPRARCDDPLRVRCAVGAGCIGRGLSERPAVHEWLSALRLLPRAGGELDQPECWPDRGRLFGPPVGRGARRGARVPLQVRLARRARHARQLEHAVHSAVHIAANQPEWSTLRRAHLPAALGGGHQCTGLQLERGNLHDVRAARREPGHTG